MLRLSTILHGYSICEIDIVDPLQLTLYYVEWLCQLHIQHVAPWSQPAGSQTTLVWFNRLGCPRHLLISLWWTLTYLPWSNCFDLCDGISAELWHILYNTIEQVDAPPWVPKLVVSKKAGCTSVNLRAVHNTIIPDIYPLLIIEELMAHFYRLTEFIKLELLEGYLGVPLHDESRNLTTFLTHSWIFRYKHMT